MTNTTLGLLGASMLLLLAYTPSLGQGRCPAGESGCTMDNAAERIQERVNQGVREVQEADTVREKVDATKETLKDCMNCGMDAVTEGSDKAGKFDSDE